MRGLTVLVCATLLLLFSMAIPWQPLFQLALALYALTALCLAWIANALWGISFERPSPPRRGQVGQLLHDAFVLANRSPSPKLAVEIHDHSTLPGHRGSGFVNIAPRARQESAMDSISDLRGAYSLGPTGAAAADPFGLFVIERRIGPSSELVIYPEVVDLGNFSLPGTIVAEGTRRRRRTQQPTQDPTGARPYIAGDAMRRIHWQSSAHAGQLMVKEFEFTPAADVWIFLDLEAAVHTGSGVQSTAEYAVTAAASIAAHYLQAGRAVGLVTSGRTREVLPADRGGAQLIRMLELLAVVQADGRAPLHEVLWTERVRLQRSSTALIVSPSTDETWAGTLAQLQHSGTPTAAVLVEVSTFGGGKPATMQVAGLASAGVATYLIKRSSSIADGIRDGLLVPGRPMQA